MLNRCTGRMVVVAGAVICAFAIAGNAFTGSVQGVVKNSAGSPVSGAFVKLKNADRRLTFMVVTQAQGKYDAKNLPPGKYVVQGVGNGFQSKWSAEADVAEGKAATMDVSLTDAQAPALPNAWPGRRPGQAGGEGGGDNSTALN